MPKCGSAEHIGNVRLGVNLFIQQVGYGVFTIQYQFTIESGKFKNIDMAINSVILVSCIWKLVTLL